MEFILDPADEPPVTGIITHDGQITIGIRPSAMAPTRTDRLLRIATHADVAGTYVGKKVTPMYTAEATVVLDMFGHYHYTADVGQPQDYEESGSYDVIGTVVTFRPEDGPPYSASLENLVLTGRFRVIGAMPATEMILYSLAIQGILLGQPPMRESSTPPF